MSLPSRGRDARQQHQQKAPPPGVQANGGGDESTKGIVMALHPDFPERAATNSSWDQPDPLGDIISALDYANKGVTIGDIAKVDAYDITSNAGKWAPGGSVESELSLTILGQLHDGRWFGLEAGNDYTGWGCMGDQADLYLGDSREDVIRNGLTEEGRNALGVSS